MNTMIKALGDSLEQQLDALEKANDELTTLTDPFRIELNRIHTSYLISDIKLLRAAIKNLNELYTTG
jgi:hypothetical protein